MAGNRSKALRQVLEQDIVTGTLKPGERLDEVSIAQRFKVSRTPVREALHQLESLGLVELRPRRGAVVASVSIKDIVEMFELMSELEGLCGKFAAQRMSDEERQNLRDIHMASRPHVDADEPDAYYAVNMAFHEAIYNGSHNAHLARETLRLRNRVAPYRRLQLRAKNRLDKSFTEHEAVVDAIVTGDADRAQDALKDHVFLQTGAFNDFLSTLPWTLLKDSMAEPLPIHHKKAGE